MLHERCVSFLLKAQADPAENLRCRVKAQNILSQLQQSLKVNDAVSQSLFYLYDYCYMSLDQNHDTENVRAIMVFCTMFSGYLSDESEHCL